MGDVNERIESWAVLGPVLVVFAAAVAVNAARGRPDWRGKNAVTRLVFAVYVAGVLHFTFFPLHVMYGIYENRVAWYEQVNPLPLLNADFSFVPNVALTVPLGLLLPLLLRNVDSAKRAARAAALASLGIEVLQIVLVVVIHNDRGGDVNDVIANTLGGAVGYLLLRLALRGEIIRRFLTGFALPRSTVAAERSGHRAEGAEGAEAATVRPGPTSTSG